jgi:hypothetical protein
MTTKLGILQVLEIQHFKPLVIGRGDKWDLPFDRMTTKLGILQVLEIQHFKPLVIGTGGGSASGRRSGETSAPALQDGS